MAGSGIPAADRPGEALDPEAIEAARKLFAGPCDFVAGAARVDSLPPPVLPEVALAGRSNVGKSSLLNALTGRRALARTSQTPGRTQQINFFDLGHRLMLVDLPGYGYARAGRGAVQKWSQLIELYLKGRARLRRVLVLIDARRGVGPHDRTAMDMMDAAAVSYQVVLTKADKLGKDENAAHEIAAAVAEAIRGRPAAHPEVLVTSSATGEGIDALRVAVAALAQPAQLG
jgi:GTP-binding protein